MGVQQNAPGVIAQQDSAGELAPLSMRFETRRRGDAAATAALLDEKQPPVPPGFTHRVAANKGLPMTGIDPKIRAATKIGVGQRSGFEYRLSNKDENTKQPISRTFEIEAQQTGVRRDLREVYTGSKNRSTRPETN